MLCRALLCPHPGCSRPCFVSRGLFRCPHLRGPDEWVALLWGDGRSDRPCQSLWGFGGQDGTTGLDSARSRPSSKRFHPLSAFDAQAGMHGSLWRQPCPRLKSCGHPHIHSLTAISLPLRAPPPGASSSGLP